MNKDPSVPTRRIHHTMATRKTYLTSGNNFLTSKDMISFMVCWVSFLRKALQVVNHYVCFLLPVMSSSLSNYSM